MQRDELFDSKREGKKNTKINVCKCRNPSKVSERAEMRAVEIRTCANLRLAKIPAVEMPPNSKLIDN